MDNSRDRGIGARVSSRTPLAKIVPCNELKPAIALPGLTLGQELWRSWGKVARLSTPPTSNSPPHPTPPRQDSSKFLCLAGRCSSQQRKSAKLGRGWRSISFFFSAILVLSVRQSEPVAVCGFPRRTYGFGLANPGTLHSDHPRLRLQTCVTQR